MPVGGTVTVAGGIFDIGGNMTEAGLLEVNGGSVIDSVGGGEINAQKCGMRSGTVSAVIAGDIYIAQVGPGTTVLRAESIRTREARRSAAGSSLSPMCMRWARERWLSGEGG